MQAAAVDTALDSDNLDPAREAVVAAASTLADLRNVAPVSSRLLTEHRPDAMLGEELSDGLRTDLLALDKALRSVLRRLADAALGRHDREASTSSPSASSTCPSLASTSA